MKERITAFILTSLTRTTSEDDIILSVCQKTGWGWEKAQALIEEVKRDHQVEIEARQIPLKSFLAFMFYALGILLTIGPIIYLWILLNITNMLASLLSGGLTPVTAYALIRSRCLIMSWFELPSLFFTMAVGIGIIQANLQYLRGIWEGYLRKWKVM